MVGSGLNRLIDSEHPLPRDGFSAYRWGMTTKKMKWADLSPGTRRTLTVGGIVQLLLLVLAQRDLSRRPGSQIRGGKGLWRAATLINFIGPLAYFILGRRRK